MGTVVRKCKCETPKCGHPWTVRYREPGGRTGRQREKSFPLKQQASAYLAEVESKKNQGLYLDPARGSITVKAWAWQWVSSRDLAPATVHAYSSFIRNHLEPAIGTRPLGRVTATDIDALIRAMNRSGLAASTIRADMIPLRGMFSAAVRDKRIPENPCTGVSLPRQSTSRVDKDRLPTLAVVRTIAEAITDRYSLSVWLMAGAGLRISEAMAVTEDCLRGDILRVWQQTSGSTEGGSFATHLAPLKHRARGDYREIPLPPFIVEQFTAHLDKFGTTTIDGQPGILFPSTGGVVPGRHAPGPKLSTSSTYDYHWRKVMRALGMSGPDGRPRHTPHDLRHFFASTALAGGMSLVEVSRWLGHQSISITADTYGHLTEDAPDRMRRVMQDALRPPLRVVKTA